MEGGRPTVSLTQNVYVISGLSTAVVLGALSLKDLDYAIRFCDSRRDEF